MTAITLALPWCPGIKPAEAIRYRPAVQLAFARSEWHCTECGREGRVLRLSDEGIVSCPRCTSRAVLPVAELILDGEE
jgi:DNA-directed RNA polymerase subunit RPC12/RpoP